MPMYIVGVSTVCTAGLLLRTYTNFTPFDGHISKLNREDTYV
jgi:hypothetical protein